MSFSALRSFKSLGGPAGPTMRAMILLGINCGFGNTDCAILTEDKIDLAGGWATLTRRKTGIKRRCPLWPETISALRERLGS